MSFNTDTREDFQKSHRNSLGNESIATISSSVADEILQQNIKNESNLREIEERLKQHQKVKIDSSKSIQVGEIIYNFYTPPPDGQQSEIDPSQIQ